MASSFLLSRRLASKLLVLQNPNPKSLLPSVFHGSAFLGSLPEPKHPIAPSSSDLPISFRFSVAKPSNPNLWPLGSHSLSSLSASNFRSQSLFPAVFTKPRNPNPNPLPTRHLSSTPPESVAPELRHQEIVGPTVERDVSALADETRVAIEALRKSIYGLSSALAILGFVHLGLGAWIAYVHPPSRELSTQGLAAFAFPFTLAFLMRRTLKPVGFFRKMEEQGRLQILTLALQVTKALNLLFLRARVLSICCIFGISVGSLVALWPRMDNLW